MQLPYLRIKLVRVTENLKFFCRDMKNAHFRTFIKSIDSKKFNKLPVLLSLLLQNWLLSGLQNSEATNSCFNL